jgi:hypothetical protein
VIPRAVTGPVDELAATLVDLRARVQTVELLAHRHVFNLDPTAWTPVVFQNGWADLAGWQAMQYRRVGDVVQLRGVITAGAIGAVAFTLPVGFRPPAALQSATTSNGAFGAFTIAANGNVTPIVGVIAAFAVLGSFSVTP